MRQVRSGGHGPESALVAMAGAVAFMVAPAPAAAQHEHDHAPYAGQQEREIKALSADEVRELLEGEGMGLAKAAELNGLPGPKHVLELAAELRLSEPQTRTVEEIRARMLEAAVELGRQVLDRERALDRRFASGEIDAGEIERRTGEIAALRGRLRAVHLKAHLETVAVLSDEQVGAYNRHRGYGS